LLWSIVGPWLRVRVATKDSNVGCCTILLILPIWFLCLVTDYYSWMLWMWLAIKCYWILISRKNIREAAIQYVNRDCPRSACCPICVPLETMMLLGTLSGLKSRT